jgi:hypothetical protein
MNVTTPNVDTIIQGDCLEEMKKLPDISRNSRREQAKIFCVEEILPDALDEIERLRAENLELQGEVFGPDGIRANQACIIADQAASISELEIEITELKADLEQSERVIDQQAARIKSLKKEIRRLKHESKVEQEFTNSYIKRLHDAEARIKELGSSLDEAEALTKKNAELMNGYLRRIAELEDALAEERAKVIMLIEKLQLVANDPDWQSKGLKHDFDWYLAESKKQIESGEPEDQRCRRLGEPNGWTDPEGKIGPDADAKPREGLYGKYRIAKVGGSPVDPNADYFVLRLDSDPVARRAALQYSYMTPDRTLAIGLQEKLTKYNPKMEDCINLQFFGMEKPRIWRITEERKAAIDRGLQFLEWSYAKNSAHDTKEQIAVLWAMLEEDTHGKP